MNYVPSLSVSLIGAPHSRVRVVEITGEGDWSSKLYQIDLDDWDQTPEDQAEFDIHISEDGECWEWAQTSRADALEIRRQIEAIQASP